MSLGWIMGSFFVFVTFVFIVIAFFLPEWVGITGKKAKQNLKDHEEGSKVDTATEDEYFKKN